jgi:arginine dihydrolase
MATFLMCPPDYYGIEYEINPWMSRSRNSIPELAREQWQALYELLTKTLCVQVELIQPGSGFPDMVFTANAGLVCGEQFIASNFRYEVRKGEASYFERWFKDHGYTVHHLPPNYDFEGAGDILPLGETLFAGYRIRSNIRAHTLVGEILGKRVLTLELVDERFYHLDTCFCPMDPERAIYYPKAFDEYAQRVIREQVPKSITVSDEDAVKFGCNAVVVERNVILQKDCLALRERLEREGFRVFEVDLSEFIKAGGSAKCLTLSLK